MAFDFKDLAGKIVDKLDDKDINIEELIDKVVDQIKYNDDMLDNFKKEPVKTVEKLLNIDLPDEIIEKVVDAVKAKISIDDAKELFGKIKGLFDKD